MAFRIDIKLVGDKKLRKAFTSLSVFFRSEKLYTVLQDSVNRIVFIANRLAPKGETRLLSSQIHGRVENFGTPKVSIRIGSPQRYAAMVEFGSKPHIIKPVRRKSLFWYKYSTAQNPLPGGAGATFTFADKVDHPGHKPQPFLKPAVKQVQPRLIQAIQRVLAQTMKGA